MSEILAVQQNEFIAVNGNLKVLSSVVYGVDSFFVRRPFKKCAFSMLLVLKLFTFVPLNTEAYFWRV